MNIRCATQGHSTLVEIIHVSIGKKKFYAYHMLNTAILVAIAVTGDDGFRMAIAIGVAVVCVFGAIRRRSIRIRMIGSVTCAFT